ncbi:GTP-binding protein 2-like [Nymphalis io]|uniref:GTP-binding protein 2-like n=1 Tax=Inachis io TaxID=171585 RepID=UPI0021691D09|nr:GTP-binding protein 2-like [Nymphalis io]
MVLLARPGGYAAGHERPTFGGCPPGTCRGRQASVHVLRHSTAIYPGFQCSVHVGNVRQTAIIEGIMSPNNVLRAGEGASVLFRFARCPEYLVRGRRLLFTVGLGTRAIGRVTQTFPYIP